MFILNFFADIVFFTILIVFLYFCKNKFVAVFHHFRNIDSENWLPSEQMKEFKQLFYLIIAGLLIADLYYLIVVNSYLNYILNLVIFDFIISIFAAVYIFDKDNLIKSIILVFTLVPFTGYTFTGAEGLNLELFVVFELIHIIGILYIIVVSFKHFKYYSKSHKLGYTVLLLYIIVCICVFISTQVQHLDLLDSLVYCSNAFTSNGYGLVNATNFGGKIISLILVWSGFIFSGVTTALLTLALVSRYYNKKIDTLEEKANKTETELEEVNKKLDLLLNEKR